MNERENIGRAKAKSRINITTLFIQLLLKIEAHGNFTHYTPFVSTTRKASCKVAGATEREGDDTKESHITPEGYIAIVGRTIYLIPSVFCRPEIEHIHQGCTTGNGSGGIIELRPRYTYAESIRQGPPKPIASNLVLRNYGAESVGEGVGMGSRYADPSQLN